MKMRQFCAAAVCALTILLPMTFAQATSTAKTLTVLIDVSGSNPLLIDTRFNQNAASFVKAHITPLKRKDSVEIYAFGSLQAAENFDTKTFEITRHNATSVARKVENLILAFPNEANPQGSTNLLAWFGRHSPNCAEGSKIIVLTDGIEASEYIPNPNDFINGKVQLPAPNEFVSIKGCEVVFYGLGVGVTDTQFNHLRRSWGAWFTQAEATFTSKTL